jgi:hypothetical protein
LAAGLIFEEVTFTRMYIKQERDKLKKKNRSEGRGTAGVL